MFSGRGRSIHRLLSSGIGNRAGYYFSANRMSTSALVATIGVVSSAVVISTSHLDETPSLLKGTHLGKKICSCEGGDAKIRKKISGGGLFNLDSTYYLMEELGEGAYGTVYKALRKSDNAVVALKTMPREYTGKTDFEREVAAMQILSKGGDTKEDDDSSNGKDYIVQLYDLHRDDENYYLALEFIEGGELLDHLIDHGAYSEGIAASFLRQLAEALSYVHRNGLVHNDLKPENLLLSSNDMSKVSKYILSYMNLF